MAHGLMSRILRDCFLAVIHSRRSIGITDYLFPEIASNQVQAAV